jgi:hypothetical protein
VPSEVRTDITARRRSPPKRILDTSATTTVGVLATPIWFGPRRSTPDREDGREFEDGVKFASLLLRSKLNDVT